MFKPAGALCHWHVFFHVCLLRQAFRHVLIYWKGKLEVCAHLPESVF